MGSGSGAINFGTVWFASLIWLGSRFPSHAKTMHACMVYVLLIGPGSVLFDRL